MNHITNIPGRYPSKSLRLAARIIGTIWILFLIFLFIGELLEGRTRNSGVVHETPDNFGIAIVICMGIGLAGLVIRVQVKTVVQESEDIHWRRRR